MHLFYIDDSSEGGQYGFSAIGVPSESWRETFSTIKGWRQQLKESDGIYMRKELHATELVAGRGAISPHVVPKGRRCQIFRDGLSMLASMDQLLLFTVILSRQDWAFERLLNRINRTMVAMGSHALLISDEGKEGVYTKLVRKMSVHNPIPSQYGVWLKTGQSTRNIPIERILEDPIFRPSQRSYLLQMADLCAFSLIRYVRGVRPEKTKYGLHTAFELLEPICCKEANPKHPLGVIGLNK
jgi:hypothetical protein